MLTPVSTDIGWPQPEPERVLRAALGDHAEAIAAWESFCREVSLDDVDDGTCELLPQVYRNLLRHEYGGPTLDRLQAIATQTRLQNQALFEETMPAVQCLHLASIPTMLLRGTALSVSASGRDARPLRSFDLLVPTRDFGRALELLTNQGWRSSTGFPASLTLTQQRYRRAVELVNPQGRILNLHWHLLHQSRSPRADAGFWKRAWPIDLLEGGCWRLPPTDQLLEICAQGLENRQDAPGRWVFDAMMTIRAGKVDWDLLLNLARQHDVVLPLRDALRYLRESFQAPVPRSVIWRLRKLPMSRFARMEYRQQVRPDAAPNPLVKLVAAYRDYRRGVRDWPLLRRLAGFPAYLAFSFRLPGTRQITES